MDDDIKKQNVQVDANRQKSLFEYNPKYPIPGKSSEDVSVLTDQEKRAIENVKKIKDSRELSNLPKYPWEDLDYNQTDDNIPIVEKKKYEKRTINITPQRLIEIQAKEKSKSTTYIIINQYGDDKKSASHGSDGNFVPKQGSNDTDDGSNHNIVIYGTNPKGENTGMGIPKEKLKGKGWPFKYVPNTEGWGRSRYEETVQARKIPGVNNGEVTKTLQIKATLNPWSNDKKTLYDEAAISFNKMYDAALKDGIKIYVSSGYRTWQEQAAVVKKYGRKVAAKVRGSNHGWGKAIDVWPATIASQELYIKCLIGEVPWSKLNWNGRSISRSQFEDSKKWINLNGDKFGWYWGDAWNENWHFVYVW